MLCLLTKRRKVMLHELNRKKECKLSQKAKIKAMQFLRNGMWLSQGLHVSMEWKIQTILFKMMISFSKWVMRDQRGQIGE